MTALVVIGLIALIILGMFLPRCIGCLVIGAFTGGLWWILFGSLAFIGVIVDVWMLENLD